MATLSKGHYVFYCPGCKQKHMIVSGETDPGIKSPKWNWDGNAEAPTFSPSILVTKNPNDKYRCHSFIRGGVWEFLNDCSHELAGQKVPMVDLPDYMLEGYEK